MKDNDQNESPTPANSGIFISKLDQDMAEISELMKNSNGYQITISIFKAPSDLNHYLVTNNFPKVDMAKSHSKCKQLIVERLEE